MRPYALPHVKSLFLSTWERAVARISHRRYLQETTEFEEARSRSGYYTINQANHIVATPEPGQAEQHDPVTEQGPGLMGHPGPAKDSHDPAPVQQEGNDKPSLSGLRR